MIREPIHSNYHLSPPPSDAIAMCVAATTAAVNAFVALAIVAMVLVAWLVANPAYLNGVGQ